MSQELRIAARWLRDQGETAAAANVEAGADRIEHLEQENARLRQQIDTLTEMLDEVAIAAEQAEEVKE